MVVDLRQLNILKEATFVSLIIVDLTLRKPTGVLASSSFASELVKHRPVCFSKLGKLSTTAHVPSRELGYIKIQLETS